MSRKLINFAFILAIVVVVLGAWTRLSDAGLGCPDWPGCYGKIIVPETVSAEYQRPLDKGKAWKEMIHRYSAALLGLVVIFIFLRNLFTRQPAQKSALSLSVILLSVVIFQALLGMWTVTELVHPGIVSLHLLGGFLTTALIFWLGLDERKKRTMFLPIKKTHRRRTVWALVIVVVQIMLGGWVSTNYAALACGDFFPTCLGKWWPEMDFSNAFYWGALGINYEFGVLENPARTAIQMTHRIGALVVLATLVALIFSLRRVVVARGDLILIGIFLALQIVLGILNVALSLPMMSAILHNIFALFLLLGLVRLLHRLSLHS